MFPYFKFHILAPSYRSESQKGNFSIFIEFVWMGPIFVAFILFKFRVYSCSCGFQQVPDEVFCHLVILESVPRIRCLLLIVCNLPGALDKEKIKSAKTFNI